MTALAGLVRGQDFTQQRASQPRFFEVPLSQSKGASALMAAITGATYMGGESKKYEELPVNHLASAADSREVTIRCGADIEPQPILWLWPGWIAKSKLTILAGPAGAAKTTLALSIAAITSNGVAWPDRAANSAVGNVLIWSSEDSAADTLVPRLIASGADLSRCHFIEGFAQNGKSMPFDPAHDIPELHRTVMAIGGVSLLLIDPIVSAIAGDMHRANDVRRGLQAIVDFAEMHSCAVIGITHFAKGGIGKTPQDRVIGSQAFGALARTVLVVAKDEDGSRRVLARAKSNISADDGGIAYSLEQVVLDNEINATYVVWGASIDGTARSILGEVETGGDEESRSELKQLIIKILSEANGTIPAKVLESEVRSAGHSWDTAKRLKKELGIESLKMSMGGPWIWRMRPQ